MRTCCKPALDLERNERITSIVIRCSDYVASAQVEEKLKDQSENIISGHMTSDRRIDVDMTS